MPGTPASFMVRAPMSSVPLVWLSVGAGHDPCSADMPIIVQGQGAGVPSRQSGDHLVSSLTLVAPSGGPLRGSGTPHGLR